MRPLIVIRRVPKIDFMRWHIYGFAFSLALTAVTIGLFLTKGLNYGIDFVGGTLIEARVTTGAADLAAMRHRPRSCRLCATRSVPASNTGGRRSSAPASAAS